LINPSTPINSNFLILNLILLESWPPLFLGVVLLCNIKSDVSSLKVPLAISFHNLFKHDHFERELLVFGGSTKNDITFNQKIKDTYLKINLLSASLISISTVSALTSAMSMVIRTDFWSWAHLSAGNYFLYIKHDISTNMAQKNINTYAASMNFYLIINDFYYIFHTR